MKIENFTDVLRVSFKYGQPNPLNILIDDPKYGSFRLPDLTESFKDDLIGYWGKLEDDNGQVRRDKIISLLIYYFFDLLLEFKRKSGGVLPSNIVDDAFTQVMQAYRNMAANNPEDTITTVRQHVLSLFHDRNIIADTERYMQAL